MDCQLSASLAQCHVYTANYYFPSNKLIVITNVFIIFVVYCVSLLPACIIIRIIVDYICCFIVVN